MRSMAGSRRDHGAIETSGESERELVGDTACNGGARGTVRVIVAPEQTGRVETDDILVTPMTTPGFLPAMKRAAAIVTDEGGITRHAAIVAQAVRDWYRVRHKYSQTARKCMSVAVTVLYTTPMVSNNGASFSTVLPECSVLHWVNGATRLYTH